VGREPVVDSLKATVECSALTRSYQKAAKVEMKVVYRVIYYGMSGLQSVSVFEFSVRK